jgi:MFS family permease
MSFLTYMGEYAAFIIVLVFLTNKFVENFALGDFGYAFVGTISGAFLIASGLVAIYMGHLCDIYGRRRMMIIGCLVGSAALLSLILANSLTQLVPFAIATAASLTTLGLAHGTYTAATLAYGGDLAEKHQTMGKAYGLVDGAEFAGYAFGPALGTTVAFLADSTTVVFEMSTVMLLISAGLAVIFMPEIRTASAVLAPPMIMGASHDDDDDDHNDHDHDDHTHDDHTHDDHTHDDHTHDDLDDHHGGSHAGAHSHGATWGDYVNAFRTPIVSVALLTTLVGAIGFSAFFSFVPLYARTLVGTVPQFKYLFGYFASIMAITGVLFMVPLGHYEDRTERRMPYLVAGLIGAACSLSIVFFFPASLASFLIAAVAYGLSIGAVRVSQLVILAEASHPSNRAAIMGTNHALEHVGYGLAAVLIGALIALPGALGGFVNAFRILSLILVIAGLAFLVYARWAKVK